MNFHAFLKRKKTYFILSNKYQNLHTNTHTNILKEKVLYKTQILHIYGQVLVGVGMVYWLAHKYTIITTLSVEHFLSISSVSHPLV